MAQNSKQELVNIQNQLRNIIVQISRVSNEMRTVKGLGAEKCTQQLDKIVREYRRNLNKLEGINLDSEI